MYPTPLTTQSFIKQYNQSHYRGKADEKSVRRFEEDTGLIVEEFNDDYEGFEHLANEFDALGYFIGDPESDDGLDIARARPGIPFGSKWFRLDHCELKKAVYSSQLSSAHDQIIAVIHDGPEAAIIGRAFDNTLDQVNELGGGISVQADSWVFQYGGTMIPYEPSESVLDEFARITLPEISFGEFTRPVPRPPNELLAFFKQFGPLGLFFTVPERIEFNPVYLGASWVRFGRSLKTNPTVAGIPNNVMLYEEYSQLFHYSEYRFGVDESSDESQPGHEYDGGIESLQDPRKPPDESFFDGYFEDWLLVYEQLKVMQLLLKRCQESEDFELINGVLRGNVEVQLKKSSEGVTWEFQFPSLRDAMYALIAKNALSGSQWKTCQNCHGLFRPTHGNQIYCRVRCRTAFNERKRATRRS